MSDRDPKSNLPFHFDFRRNEISHLRRNLLSGIFSEETANKVKGIEIIVVHVIFYNYFLLRLSLTCPRRYVFIMS